MIFKNAVRAACPADGVRVCGDEGPAAVVAVQRLAAQVGGKLPTVCGEVEGIRKRLRPKRQGVRGNETALARLPQLQACPQDAKSPQLGQLLRSKEPCIAKSERYAVKGNAVFSEKCADLIRQMRGGLQGNIVFRPPLRRALF